MVNTDDYPISLKESIHEYISKGHLDDGFLRAVLENDLKMTILWANEITLPLLSEIVTYVINTVPTYIRDSKEVVDRHIIECAKHIADSEKLFDSGA